MKKQGIIAIAVAAADQLIKAYVRSLPEGETFFEISGVVLLEHRLNTGAAFSLLSGYTGIIALISIVLLSAIVIVVSRYLRLTASGSIAIQCLIGGGIGNLLDRLFYAGVTDYIRLLFVPFPVFNLADIAITVSIIVLLILLLTDHLEETVEGECGSDN